MDFYRYKKRFLGLLLFIFFVFPLIGLENPATSPMLSTFGERKHNSVERGITFDKTETVTASDHGTFIMQLDESLNFPSTLGKAIIINHADGLQTVYANLGETTNLLPEVQSRSIIGKTGETGFEKKESLIFQVIDVIQKAKINPLVLLPNLLEKTSPQLRAIQLVSLQGTAYSLVNNRGIPQGEYFIYIDSYDTLFKGDTKSPVFKTSFFLNGKEVAFLSFETLAEKNGRFYLASKEPLQEKSELEDVLIRNNFVRIGKVNLKQGKNNILLELSSILGNTKTLEWTVYVN